MTTIGETGVTLECDTHPNRITDVLHTIEHDTAYNEGDILVLALVMKNSKDDGRKLEAQRIMKMKLRNTDNLRLLTELVRRHHSMSFMKIFVD